MFMNITLHDISHAHNRKVGFGKHYVVGYIFAWPCDGMRMGKMAVLWHASLMPDYLTFVSSWHHSHSHSFHPILSDVFRKEYGIVSCKLFSWYTPNREAGMRVPWPWIKARHPVKGHGCFRLGPRGGHPLERAYGNLIPCYSRLWPPRLKVFLGRCLGWFLASWGGMGVYWLDVFSSEIP